MMEEHNRRAVEEEEKLTESTSVSNVKEGNGEAKRVQRASPPAWSPQERSFGKAYGQLTVVGAGGGGGAQEGRSVHKDKETSVKHIGY